MKLNEIVHSIPTYHKIQSISEEYAAHHIISIYKHTQSLLYIIPKKKSIIVSTTFQYKNILAAIIQYRSNSTPIFR